MFNVHFNSLVVQAISKHAQYLLENRGETPTQLSMNEWQRRWKN